MTNTAIPLFKVLMSPDAPKAVSEVLMSGYIGQGPKVEEFETLLKKHFNHDYLVTVNSATSALHLAVHALDLTDPNDEILTTALTCTATNWAILANKVKVRWVDVDPRNANLDLVDLERKITQHTKAIMVVHWGGYPVDLDELNNIVNRCQQRFGHRPVIIEDCAHAFGSYYKNKHVGTGGNWSAFSFQAIKHLTSVDGGVLLTPTVESVERMRLLRWYGINRNDNRKDFRCESNIAEFGFKFHMNDVNATIGLANYQTALNAVKIHQSNAAFYRQELAGVPGVELLEEHSHSKSAYWIFTIKVENRDGFMRKMAEHNIAVSRVHERNDKHTCVSEFRAALPALDAFSQKMICIPVGWWVSEDDRQRIVDLIKAGW